MVAIVTGRHFEERRLVRGDFTATPGAVRHARAAARPKPEAPCRYIRNRRRSPPIMAATRSFSLAPTFTAASPARIPVSTYVAAFAIFSTSAGDFTARSCSIDAGAVTDCAELDLQRLIGQRPARTSRACRWRCASMPAARLDHIDQEVHRLITVLIDLRVCDESVGDEIEIFELTDDESRARRRPAAPAPGRCNSRASAGR